MEISTPKIKHETLVGGLQFYVNAHGSEDFTTLYLFKESFGILLNFIQIYFLKEIKLNFFHLPIGRSFYTGKDILL